GTKVEKILRWLAALLALLVLLGVPVKIGWSFPAETPALPPAAPADAGDWPMYGHDPQHTSYNPNETTINAGNVAQLVQRWQAGIGGSGQSSSTPSVANGRVYVGSDVSSGNNFFAFDAVTGAALWPANLGHMPVGTCWDVGIGSTAAISGT